MVRAILVGVALSVCVSGSVMAQARPAGPTMAAGEPYAEIQALKSEIEALKYQMAQQKAANDKETFDVRFRLSALESVTKQGGGQGGEALALLRKTDEKLQGEIGFLTSRVDYNEKTGTRLQGEIGFLTGRIDAIQFPGKH